MLLVLLSCTSHHHHSAAVINVGDQEVLSPIVLLGAVVSGTCSICLTPAAPQLLFDSPRHDCPETTLGLQAQSWSPFLTPTRIPRHVRAVHATLSSPGCNKLANKRSLPLDSSSVRSSRLISA